MKNGKLGVCVVGCGDMGTKHAERWASVPEARVIAVVDIAEGRAKTLARVHKLDTWYTDYKLAVSLQTVDVVSVCVPTCLHSEVTNFAAENRKHVLCEKPIALTLADADSMIETTRQNGVKLGLGFMRRHSPVLPSLRDWLSAGHLGRPVMYHATDIREIRPKREMHDTYANGGPVIDMAVHLFDSWAYLFNSEPDVVTSQGLKLAEQRPELAHIDQIAYDTATIRVRYVSGDLGNFVVCWGLPPAAAYPGSIDQVFGPKGMLQITYGTDHQEVSLIRGPAKRELVCSSDEDMYQRQISRFARCIIEDQAPPVTGEDGRAALRVALVALESMETGQPVLLN